MCNDSARFKPKQITVQGLLHFTILHSDYDITSKRQTERQEVCISAQQVIESEPTAIEADPSVQR